MFKDIANGKFVFIGELSVLDDFKHRYSELNLEIARDKYNYNLFGFPIRKNTRNGRILVKM